MNEHILIVDDEASFREVIGLGLKLDHYRLSEAADAASLKKALSGAQPDVVLLDVKLPDANGIELLPQIKKRWPETEVIVLTGATKDSDEAVSWAVEAIKRGAFTFLRKSAEFDLEKLRADVRCALNRKKQNEETVNLRRALDNVRPAPSPAFRGDKKL